MSGFRHLAPDTAAGLLEAGAADVVDIRDPTAYVQGHLPGARRLDNANLREFLAQADRARPLIVCCYHGFSSMDAAQFLVKQGFAKVYSLDGGFDGWQFNFPVERNTR